MLLKHVSFSNFRNFDKREVSFNPFLTLIVGPNSKGKTNILEGLHLIIHGIGFREAKEEELIHFDAGGAACSVTGVFGEGDKQVVFRIVLIKKNNVLNKSFFVEKAKKILRLYLKEQTKAVLFAPSHIDIATGSPSTRRDYFNKILSSYDYEYKKRLSNYEQALRRRNKILVKYFDKASLEEDLSFWDGYLEEQARYLIDRRKEYVEFINSHNDISNLSFRLQYVPNEFTKEKAQSRLDLELTIKRTTIGPQKDEFVIWLKKEREKNIHHFGSRSEQRLGVLWLKMNEIYYLEEILKIKPILLFDDIFSEFDMKNKKLVLDLIKKYQSVMTTTEPEVIDLIEVPHSIIKV